MQRGRQRFSGAPVQLSAGFEEGEVERDAADPLDDRLEQRDAWLHDLAADAVAREDCYVKLAHTPDGSDRDRDPAIRRTGA